MSNQQTAGRFTTNSGSAASGQRQKCEIYTRVMGYYRPVTFFNEGKKSEYYSRTCFNENTSFNTKYC